jgi:nuclear pore complex protein Nup205
VIRGGASVFNDDFKHETLFLAQELDGSERFCAQLLHHVIRSYPASSRQGIAETALFDLHQERAALLACLRLIIENAARVNAPNTKAFRILRDFVSDLIQGPFEMGHDKPKGNMASKLLSEIDTTYNNISKQRDALRNPVPSTSLAQPTGQCSLNFYYHTFDLSL